MIFSRYGAYGGSWEDYCVQSFPGDATTVAKCQSKPAALCPIGICLPWAAPWTESGAKARGIPGPAEVQAAQQRARAKAAGVAAGVAEEKMTDLTVAALIAGGAGILLFAGGALLRRRRTAAAPGVT